MQKIAVSSSMISEIGYDEKLQRLEVTFRQTSRTYEFDHVTPDQYRDLMEAPSTGKAFNEFKKTREGRLTR